MPTTMHCNRATYLKDGVVKAKLVSRCLEHLRSVGTANDGDPIAKQHNAIGVTILVVPVNIQYCCITNLLTFGSFSAINLPGLLTNCSP